jgi:RimJ/RimL family protein N-acetyltransferase
LTLEPAELLALRFVLDERGRLIGTNEPIPERAPQLTMIRTATAFAWAVRADAEQRGGTIDEGPTFSFPATATNERVVEIDSIEPLVRQLRGWRADEIAGCRPIIAICDGADAVSVCFCARRSASAAEAGVYTAETYRGRGLAPIVTSAWARSIRGSGRTPVYSTSWTNTASLAVARKLGLVQYATQLNIVDS